MKWIKYEVNNPVNIGTEENPIMQDNLIELKVPYSDTGLEIAKAEAYNGEYEITPDDGQPEVYQPTVQEQLDAQAAALMELMEVVYND